MLEFKHPTRTTSLSALDFFRASTQSEPSSSEPGHGSSSPKKRSSKTQRAKGIDAACVLPIAIFLGTEMFTPAAGKESETPSMDVPEIVVTTDGDDRAVELPAS